MGNTLKEVLRRGFENPGELLKLLLMGEVLTPLGEDGPLARPWSAGKRTAGKERATVNVINSTRERED